MSASTVRPSVVMYGNGVNQLNALTDIRGNLVDSLVAAGQIHKESEWTSSNRLTKDDVLRRIDEGLPMKGRRRIGHALSYACENVFYMNRQTTSAESLQRPVPKVLVVFSNGYSEDEISSVLSCFNRTSQEDKSDITILGVGLNPTGVTSLQNQAVQSIFRLTGPEGLFVIDDDVIEQICSASIHSCATANFDLIFLIDG